MKKQLLFFTLCFLPALFLQVNSYAQTSKPYTEGPAWQVQFVKTKSAMGQLYLKNVREGWIKMMTGAKQEAASLNCKPSAE